jgi:hypothetical protein
MSTSPRDRRLQRDLAVLEGLRRESPIFDFQVDPRALSTAPELYRLRFKGRGLALQTRALRRSQVVVQSEHEVLLHLVAAYPRSAPHLKWLTPIYHPNIARSGAVCLGGFGTHWSPGIQLDQLCEMLWDMCRWRNFDVANPYDREAATWARRQPTSAFPVDPRELRPGHAPGGQVKTEVFRGSIAEQPPTVSEAPPPPKPVEITFLE